MELADIISVNELFQELYPYIAKQIASEYNRDEGQALEIGPYGPGISIALARLRPDLEITVGDDSPRINDYLRQKIAEAGLSHRIRVLELDKFNLPFPEESFDLVYFRGALFFWENSLQIVKEAYRVLTPLGLAMLGGGFGADTHTHADMPPDKIEDFVHCRNQVPLEIFHIQEMDHRLSFETGAFDYGAGDQIVFPGETQVTGVGELSLS